MRIEKTLSVTITVDTEEEMFSVDALEGESGCGFEFGPQPLWCDWVPALKEAIGNEVVSWVELMADER